jgi:hypothetical protein
MRRISWIVGIGAALVIACGIESALSTSHSALAAARVPQDQLQSCPADEMSAGVDLHSFELASSLACPELPPDCCIVRSNGHCAVCVQTGC